MSESLDLRSSQRQPPPVAELLALLGEVLTRLADAIGTQNGVVPEALDAGQASRFCGVSVNKWHSMNAAGHFPAPVELGDRCPRWLRSELVLWLRAGVPSRARWASMREPLLRRLGA